MDIDMQEILEKMTSRSTAVTKELQDVNATGSDDEEMVTVTCGPSGQMIDISFAPRSRRLETHELSECVLVAAKRAAEESQERTQAILDGLTATFSDLKLPNMDELKATMADTQAKLAEQQQKIERMVQEYR